jgi:hypothetical protein
MHAGENVCFASKNPKMYSVVLLPPRKNIAAIEFNSANIIGLSCVNLAEKITFAVVNKRRLSV